ncbi:MAG: hypothetical protein QM658_06750 [Gordonia sp. (in: high G+C Gram-positive bacteria)]
MATKWDRGQGRPKHSIAKRWAVQATVVSVLAAMLANAAVPNGNAAVFHPERVAHSTQVAKNTKKRPAPKPAETYEERQERIKKSPRSLLKPLEENKGKDTTCVSAEFTSLAVVFDAIYESTLPTIPAALRANAAAVRASVKQDMERITVSTLTLSENPMTLGADRDDPSMKYRSPLSQIIISDLLKIRDGKKNDAIPVSNITLSQAVETAYLFFFVAILAPVRLAIGLTPYLGSPLTGTALSSAAGYFTYNTMLQLGVMGGGIASQYIYQGISNSLMNQCVAQVTDEQKDLAGKPSDKVKYNLNIPAIVEDTANQLALADDKTCKPIGDLPLKRIVARTGEYAQSVAATPAQKNAVKAQTRALLAQMQSTRIHHNLIPADPADFSQAESLASMIGGMIPYVGGAPLDIMLGLGHNIGQGDNLAATVPIGDLTVTKSLTAAYYTYYTALYLFSTIGTLAFPGPTPPTVGYLSPIRVIATLGALPLTYGLITFHNVVRSTCFVEDDTTKTGRGAQKNKDDYDAGIRTPKDKKNKQSPSSTAPASKPRSPQNRRTGQTTTTSPAPTVPGLPGVTLPGSR